MVHSVKALTQSTLSMLGGEALPFRNKQASGHTLGEVHLREG